MARTPRNSIFPTWAMSSTRPGLPMDSFSPSVGAAPTATTTFTSWILPRAVLSSSPATLAATSGRHGLPTAATSFSDLPAPVHARSGSCSPMAPPLTSSLCPVTTNHPTGPHTDVTDDSGSFSRCSGLSSFLRQGQGRSATELEGVHAQRFLRSVGSYGRRACCSFSFPICASFSLPLSFAFARNPMTPPSPLFPCTPLGYLAARRTRNTVPQANTSPLSPSKCSSTRHPERSRGPLFSDPQVPPPRPE